MSVSEFNTSLNLSLSHLITEVFVFNGTGVIKRDDSQIEIISLYFGNGHKYGLDFFFFLKSKNYFGHYDK